MKINSKYVVITSDYLVPFFIIISVITLIYLTFYSSLFQLKNIDCQIDYQPCQNTALEAEIQKVLGVNIFQLDKKQLEDRILSGEFTIRAVKLKLELPSTLKVSMQSVLPTLSVTQLGDKRFVTLDYRYRVIHVRELDPHVINLIVPALPPVQVGYPLSSDLTPTFNLVLKVSTEFEKISHFELKQDNSIHVIFESGMVGVMSTTVDLDRQIRLLQAVLSDSTIITGKASVDVRFTQPVLK